MTLGGLLARRLIARNTRVVFALTLVVGACAPQPDGPPRVAAAANLQAALTDVAAAFTQETGQPIDLVFGSSGLLARQIREGAPFEVFLAADETSVELLAQVGFTRDAGVRYATGRLVLFTPHGSPLQAADGLEGLGRLVAAGRVSRFAIANPEHAPYGRAARQVLQAHGLWDALQPHLVLGDNVAQATQFATTGNAVGGVTAYSLVLAPEVQARGTWMLIDERDHEPITQRMALLTRAGPVATRFYEFMQSATARQILERHGFGRADE